MEPPFAGELSLERDGEVWEGESIQPVEGVCAGHPDFRVEHNGLKTGADRRDMQTAVTA
jgi:hypothetical protein